MSSSLVEVLELNQERERITLSEVPEGLERDAPIASRLSETLDKLILKENFDLNDEKRFRKAYRLIERIVKKWLNYSPNSRFLCLRDAYGKLEYYRELYIWITKGI